MNRWYAQSAWLGDNLPDVDVGVTIDVEDGVIVGVGVDMQPSPEDKMLDGLVIPGLVSAHSHAFHRALRGRTQSLDGDFWSWRQPMYGVANRLSPDAYHRLASVVFTEMLLAGITTVGEFHYLHHQPSGDEYANPNAMGEALVAAARDVGIRLTVIDTAYLTSDIAGATVTVEQRRFSDQSIGRWQERVHELRASIDSDETVSLAVAAHSIRGVHSTDLRQIAEVSHDLDVPLHIHVSEQPAENTRCIEVHGVTPVGLLDREGFLGPSTTLVHATHVTTEDIRLISNSSSGVCVCPTTEADLGDGIGPIAELASSGVRLSAGTDSNAVIDVLEEARRVELHDRLRLQRRGVHRPETLLRAATSGGAEALGWKGGGRIEVGAPADFIAVDPLSNDLAGVDLTSVGGLLMAATRASVADVVVGGRLVVSGGSPVFGPDRETRASTLTHMWTDDGTSS